MSENLLALHLEFFSPLCFFFTCFADYFSIIFDQEEDLKSFRQWGSKTPGHPENFETPGVEVTTGQCTFFYVPCTLISSICISGGGLYILTTWLFVASCITNFFIFLRLGPLGQGIANAVGLALAEKHLAARFNKPDAEIVDHYT